MHCLILTPYASVADFRDMSASRWLLTGLDQRGVQWEIHQPWKPRTDLERFDVVLCWTYYWRHHDYISWALEMKGRCEELGIPVVNDPRHADAKHSFFLKTWQAHGLPCARCQEFTRPEEITLDYPLILRRDGIHRGNDVALAKDAGEGRELIEARLADPRPHEDGGAGEPFDLAVEFIDTRWSDGYYRKWRSYVVGERVIPRQMEISESWLVNLCNEGVLDATRAEDQAFIRDGEPQAALLRRAAELSGAEISALDYSRRDNGDLVLWEANRHWRMAGDQKTAPVEYFEQITGRSAEAENLLLGLAMADLVIHRGHAEA